jgi:hypothetical protein
LTPSTRRSLAATIPPRITERSIVLAPKLRLEDLMNKRASHRWFHALVVTGASLTACGGQTDDSSADASGDAVTPADGTSAEGASPDTHDAGTPIIITDGPPLLTDVRNDPRCCSIAN